MGTSPMCPCSVQTLGHDHHTDPPGKRMKNANRVFSIKDELGPTQIDEHRPVLSSATIAVLDPCPPRSRCCPIFGQLFTAFCGFHPKPRVEQNWIQGKVRAAVGSAHSSLRKAARTVTTAVALQRSQLMPRFFMRRLITTATARSMMPLPMG